MFYVILAIVHSLIGAIFCVLWVCNAGADGWELCNPYWMHVFYRVNWFGAIMLSLLYMALCPIMAICYWFYKICTVGRR